MTAPSPTQPIAPLVLPTLAMIAAGLHGRWPDSGPVAVILHSTAGWWWLGGVVLLLLAGWQRSWLGGLLAGMATALALGWTLPGTLGASAPTTRGSPLRVAVVNVLSSNPDSSETIEAVLRESPDVVAVLELSPALAVHLDTRLDPTEWPLREAEPRDDNFGIGLYAQRAGTASVHRIAGIPWLTAEIDGVELIAAHTLPPLSPQMHGVWTEQLQWLASRATLSGHRVLLADLNLTRHNPSFHDLRRAGLTDALAAAGRAGARTWTPFRAGPDLLRLDHVLVTRELGVAGARVIPRAGSDHRALVVDLLVP